MSIQVVARFCRSDAFADDMGLDADETVDVTLDLSQGDFVNLTYHTLTDPGTGLVAFYDSGFWHHAGEAWSDVTIHFTEVWHEVL